MTKSASVRKPSPPPPVKKAAAAPVKSGVKREAETKGPPKKVTPGAAPSKAASKPAAKSAAVAASVKLVASKPGPAKKAEAGPAPKTAAKPAEAKPAEVKPPKPVVQDEAPAPGLAPVATEDLPAPAVADPEPDSVAAEVEQREPPVSEPEEAPAPVAPEPAAAMTAPEPEPATAPAAQAPAPAAAAAFAASLQPRPAFPPRPLGGGFGGPGMPRPGLPPGARIIPPRLPAKAEKFEEGDHVVYPTHGVGKVERIAVEEIAGEKLELIHITFEENRMTLRVPVVKARSAGLRKLATRKLFDEAMAVLRGKARIKRTMWSRRAQEYEAKINSGDPLAIAEVVRDLHRNAGQPDQSFSERQIYESAMDRLAAELGALEKIDKTAAAQKLTDFLKTVV